MAKKVKFSNDDFGKDSMIAYVQMSSKGVMVRDNNSSIMANIIEPDEFKRKLIRSEIEKIMDACEAGDFYQPDWSTAIYGEDDDLQ